MAKTEKKFMDKIYISCAKIWLFSCGRRAHAHAQRTNTRQREGGRVVGWEREGGGKGRGEGGEIERESEGY